MGMEEIVKEAVKPDYATSALYFFSALAETMGALLAIILTALYAIIPAIYQRTNNMSSEVLIRLMHKDPQQILGILFGVISIFISLIFIIIFQNLGLPIIVIIILESLCIVVSAISIIFVIMFVRRFRKFNHLLSYINSNNDKSIKISVNLVECYILSDVFYPYPSEKTQYRIDDIIDLLKKNTISYRSLFNTLIYDINVWHRKGYSIENSEENMDIYLKLFKVVLYFYLILHDSIKQNDIKSYCRLLAILRHQTLNKRSEADSYFITEINKYFYDYCRIQDQDLTTIVSMLDSFLIFYEHLLKEDVNYPIVIHRVSNLLIKHRKEESNEIFKSFLHDFLLKIVNIFYAYIDNKYDKGMFDGFSPEQQELFKSISNLFNQGLLISSIFNDKFDTIKHKDIVVCIPYMLKLQNFDNVFDGYKFINLNTKRVCDIVYKAYQNQMFKLPNNQIETFNHNVNSFIKRDIEQYFTTNSEWRIDNSSETEFIKSK